MKVKLIWVNLLLCLFIFFESYMIYQVWTTPDNLDGLSGTSADSGTRKKHLTMIKRSRTEGSFTDVVNKNVFSMHRKEFVSEVSDDVLTGKNDGKQQMNSEHAPLDSHLICLFGVIVVGDYRRALVQDASDRTQQAKWIQEGDSLAEFVVKRIEKDRVVISAEAGMLHTLLLYDKNSPKQRQPGPPAPAKPAKVAVEKEKSAVSGQSSPEKSNDGFEIIETPFGKFKRKKR